MTCILSAEGYQPKMLIMKQISKLLVAALILVGLSFMTSCKDDDDDNPNAEFIADANSFTNFKSWTLVAQNQGPDPALGSAHAGNDSTVTRYVYFRDNQSPADGTYPVGTRIVKESKNPDMSVHAVVAMAKRGNNFNTDGGDWEWFILTTDGVIATDNEGTQQRGADLLGGACVSCHSQNSATDYVFSK